MARHDSSIQSPDESPLLRAARLAASEELTTLLQSGHNVAAVDARGWTCIHHLCSSSEPRKEKALQILLRHGADNAAAQAFLDYLRTPGAAAVIERFGYGTDG